MENTAKYPGRNAKVCEQTVVRSQWVVRGYRGSEFRQTVLMRYHVSQAEEHAEGLLHAQNPNEGPFAVELSDGFIARDSFRGNDMLARVIAFLRACPQ